MKQVCIATIMDIFFCFMIVLPTSAADLTSRAPGGSARNVNVVNTPSVNVTNTPSVTISTTVPVQIQNQSLPVSGNVGISGTPEVKVINTVEPIQRGIVCDQYVCVPQGSLCQATVYDVPAGKRLIIESVTVKSDDIRTWLSTTLGGITVDHFLSGSVNGIPPAPFAQQVRFYADSGGVIFSGLGGCACPCTNPNLYAHISITGYLVDVP